jgi:hypothetical protein
MVRRFARPATILIVMACATLTVPPSDFLEAVTANLADLLVPGATLTEGDKTFSQFNFSPLAAPGPEGTFVTVPSAAAIDVTASTGPGGVITLAFPLNMSASSLAGASGAAFGNIELSFNVEVAGSDEITGVTLTSIGDPSTGTTGTGASVVALSGALSVLSPGTDSEAFLGVPALSVEATAAVVAVGGDEATSAEIDTVTFDFIQTPTGSTPVPEPGSLTLILGGVGILLARSLYGRRG